MSRGVMLLTLVAGCAMSQGPLGLMGPSPNAVGTKLLRPDVIGRSCRSRILGIPLRAGGPELREALAQVLALDDEGEVVVNANVRSWVLLTGVYDRRCIEIRGDLARVVPTIIVPGPASHQTHGAHH